MKTKHSKYILLTFKLKKKSILIYERGIFIRFVLLLAIQFFHDQLLANNFTKFELPSFLFWKSNLFSILAMFREMFTRQFFEIKSHTRVKKNYFCKKCAVLKHQAPTAAYCSMRMTARKWWREREKYLKKLFRSNFKKKFRVQWFFLSKRVYEEGMEMRIILAWGKSEFFFNFDYFSFSTFLIKWIYLKLFPFCLTLSTKKGVKKKIS